jgi:glyoxylase-like metal-dependent hydrolase (beta-lactamase superfamily II)
MTPHAALLPLLVISLPLASAPGASFTPPGPAQTPAQVVRTADPAARGYTDADFPRIQKLADGVYSYEQLRSAGDETFTTVSLFVVTSEGVLVADGQGNAAETRRMVEEIGRVTSQPIAHVVICSDHGDHTGGNAAFPPGATFYAHPTSRAVLEAGAARGGRRGGAPAPLPTVDVTDRTVLRLGGREVHLLFLGRAHTGGDLSVYLPREKVLFMSEAYLNRVFPAMRSAYPTEWVGVIRRAEAMDVDVYVPGHGFVESPAILKEELATYRQALERVIAEGKRLHDAGTPADQAVGQARFGDLETWTLRASQGAIAIRRVYLELDGGLPQAGGGG